MFARKTKLNGQLYNTQQLDIFLYIYIHKILRKSVETLGRHLSLQILVGTAT
jgi:hypothetical protein